MWKDLLNFPRGLPHLASPLSGQNQQCSQKTSYCCCLLWVFSSRDTCDAFAIESAQLLICKKVTQSSYVSLFCLSHRFQFLFNSRSYHMDMSFNSCLGACLLFCLNHSCNGYTVQSTFPFSSQTDQIQSYYERTFDSKLKLFKKTLITQ